jgi:stage IV sporulation protein FB
MGHAVAARFYGAWSSITLVAFGGFASYSPSPHKAWKRLVISAAGPAVNFAIVGLVFGIEKTLRTADQPVTPYLQATLLFLFIQNLFWGIFNLFPIWPLDGGRIFRELCAMAGSRKADIVTHSVSICVAGFFALWGILTVTGNHFPALKQLFFNFEPTLMMTVFFAMFAFENYQMLEHYRRQRQSFYYDDDAPPWSRR